MAVFDQARLLDGMRRSWNHGERLALVWTATPDALRVLMVERSTFLALCRDRPQLWSERRYRAPPQLLELARTLGRAGRVVTVVLAGRPDAALHARMEKLVERFSVRLHLRRPVALVDLVGFSKLGPLEQLVRLAALEQAVGRAEVTLARACHGFAPMRTTTGDGFYIWDPENGTSGATKLLALVLATFVHFGAAGRESGFDPRALKASLGIGACFTFHRVAARTPQEDTFVVGAVTVEIARLMAACRPGQILLGTGAEHRRLGDWGVATTAVNEMFEAGGAADIALRAELTGSRHTDGGPQLDRYVVRAKHGWTYPAVNLAARATIAGKPEVLRLGLCTPAANRAA